MTTYGTIPTNLEYTSRAKHTRRPWRQMFSLQSLFTLFPHSLHEATTRVRTNISYFFVNYAMIILGIVFVSLLWHPLSLIAFIFMMALWVFFYFFRDEPLVVFGKTVGDRTVMVVLAVLTVGVLLLTKAVVNVVVSLVVGVVVVLVHAAVRLTEDLDGD